MVHVRMAPSTPVETESSRAERGSNYPFVLVVSDYPPFAGGVGLSSCIILGRLFEDYPRDRIAYACLACHRQAGTLPAHIRPERVHTLGRVPNPRLARLGLSKRVGGRLANGPRQWLDGRGHRSLCDELRRTISRCDRVDLVFSSPVEAGALFRAASSVCAEDSIPFATYFMDDWRNSEREGAGRERVGRWQAEALAIASQIFTIGPGMRDRFASEYGVDADVIPQVVDTRTFFWRPLEPSHPGPFRIAFTGTIYEVQDDAIAVLVEALERINAGSAEPKVVLDLYSNLSAGMLTARGWDRPFVNAHGAIPSSVVPFVLASADLLYVPLSFKPEFALTVATSVPGKLSEYAASGRPVLVHTPPDADVSRICREQGFGVICNSADVAELARVVEELIGAPDRMKAMATETHAAAAYYDQRAVQQRLYRRLREVGRPAVAEARVPGSAVGERR